ncbi:hypothetical protein V1519DRAFT_449821, partial [Lipomyces tetrasporus]
MTSSYPTALEPGNDITLDSDDERELNEPIIAKQDAVVAQSTKLQSTASKRQANEALLNKSENATVKFQKFSPLVNGPSLSTYSNLRTNDSNAGVPTPQPLLTNQDSLAAGKVESFRNEHSTIQSKDTTDLDESENDTIDAEHMTSYESSHTSLNIDDLFQLIADMKHRRQKNSDITETGFEQQYSLVRDLSFSDTDRGAIIKSKSRQSTTEFGDLFKGEKAGHTGDSLPDIGEYVDYVEDVADETIASTVIEPGAGFATIVDFLHGYVDVVD